MSSESNIVSFPHIERIKQPLKLIIQSASTSRVILCSKDIMQMRSNYFKEIIEQSTEEDEIILPEDDPEEASNFLLSLHNLSFASPHIQGATRQQELQWNKTWAYLSVSSPLCLFCCSSSLFLTHSLLTLSLLAYFLQVKWQIEGYIEAYSLLISQQLNAIISSSNQNNGNKKQRACSSCQRVLSSQQTHNNVWCNYCGTYTNTILVASSLLPNVPSNNSALFWEIVEVILSNPCLQRAPIQSREDLTTILSRHRELWSKEHMIQFLSKEDLYQLCTAL